MNQGELFFEKLHKSRSNDIKVLLKPTYRGIWETAIKKYSDSAHFVYELLQNADDAQATWVEFRLQPDGLWFKHDGSIRFTITNPEIEETAEPGETGHINAITSIGNSNKIEEQKIGKFGIGFKAVFAYTSTPHIYDDLSFKLENYIVPKPLPPHPDRQKNETLFFFPFDHQEKSAEEAYEEIEEKLSSMYLPTLFLNHIEIMEWKSERREGTYDITEGKLSFSMMPNGVQCRHVFYESMTPLLPVTRSELN